MVSDVPFGLDEASKFPPNSGMFVFHDENQQAQNHKILTPMIGSETSENLFNSLKNRAQNEKADLIFWHQCDICQYECSFFNMNGSSLSLIIHIPAESFPILTFGLVRLGGYLRLNYVGLGKSVSYLVRIWLLVYFCSSLFCNYDGTCSSRLGSEIVVDHLVFYSHLQFLVFFIYPQLIPRLTESV